jgi:hypothetical protein
MNPKFKGKSIFCLLVTLVMVFSLLPFASSNVKGDTYYATQSVTLLPSDCYGYPTQHIDSDSDASGIREPQDNEYLQMSSDDAYGPPSEDYILTFGFTSAYAPLGLNDFPGEYDIITSINIVLITKEFLPVAPGNFSYCVDYPIDTYTPGDPMDYGTWTTSNTTSYFDGYDEDYFNPFAPFTGNIYGNVTRIDNVFYWEIMEYNTTSGVTTGDNITVNELTTFSSFRVVWQFLDYNWKTMYSYFDYLGVTIRYLRETSAFGPGDGDLSLENMTMGIMYLAVIFLPAIGLGYFIPKIGFAVGIVVMVLILSFLDSTFIYVTVIGLASIAVLFFKSNEEYV